MVRNGQGGTAMNEKPSAIASVSKRLRKICISLPEAASEPYGDHLTFRVRKKVFAYFLNNHHGDGIVCVAAKVAPGDNNALVAAQPERFCLPAYIASRGWVSLRLDVGEVDWEEVRELVSDSYRRVAPKRLAETVGISE
jgi:predicted DNA-binding protein (MmcQ/YjbR family)